VSDDELPDFGSPEGEVTTAAGVPFPRMRANPRLAEAWAARVEHHNRRASASYKFQSPAASVDELIKLRTMPVLPLPPSWTRTARRVRAYPRDVVGIVGSQGGGKTSFAIQWLLGAIGRGHPGLWAALELTPPEIDTRIVGNMHGVHASTVRDSWPRSKIDHSLAAIVDSWHYVDKTPRREGPEKQIAAMRAAISVAWEVYRMPPVTVVDHIGKLTIGTRDRHAATTEALEMLRELAEDTDSIVLALSQGSRANQGVLTGRVDVDSASDAMGVAADSRAFEEDCSYVIALAVFKADDKLRLDVHALFTKCRHTGLEGREGFQFSKPGGQWFELDHLPATPSEIKAEGAREKREKHRVAPPRNTEQIRVDLNASRAGDAAAMRRAKILEAVRRHGALGIAYHDLRRQPGVGKGALFAHELQELVRTGSVERTSSNRVRMIASNL